jgi:hypothetical protein
VTVELAFVLGIVIGLLIAGSALGFYNWLRAAVRLRDRP